MQVSLQYAQTHLPELVSAANRGEQVEVAQPNLPDTKLLLVARPELPPPSGKRRLGAWRGLVVLPTDEEWRVMDEEVEREMLDGPVFPVEPE